MRPMDVDVPYFANLLQSRRSCFISIVRACSCVFEIKVVTCLSCNPSDRLSDESTTDVSRMP